MREKHTKSDFNTAHSASALPQGRNGELVTGWIRFYAPRGAGRFVFRIYGPSPPAHLESCVFACTILKVVSFLAGAKRTWVLGSAADYDVANPAVQTVRAAVSRSVSFRCSAVHWLAVKLS